MLARMVWGTSAVKIEVQMGICFLLRRVLRLARMLWGTHHHQNGDLTKLLKSARKKCPTVPV